MPHWGRKFTQARHIGRKIGVVAQFLGRKIHEGAVIAQRTGELIGHERLAQVGGEFAHGPIISHETQRNIANRGFGIIDNAMKSKK